VYNQEWSDQCASEKRLPIDFQFQNGLCDASERDVECELEQSVTRFHTLFGRQTDRTPIARNCGMWNVSKWNFGVNARGHNAASSAERCSSRLISCEHI